MLNKFKIAIIQQRPIPNDLDANTVNGIAYVKAAKQLGADIMERTFRKVHAYKDILSEKVEEPFIHA